MLALSARTITSSIVRPVSVILRVANSATRRISTNTPSRALALLSSRTPIPHAPKSALRIICQKRAKPGNRPGLRLVQGSQCRRRKCTPDRVVGFSTWLWGGFRRGVLRRSFDSPAKQHASTTGTIAGAGYKDAFSNRAAPHVCLWLLQNARGSILLRQLQNWKIAAGFGDRSG